MGMLQAIPIISITKYFLSVYMSKYYSNAKVNKQWAATTNQTPLSKKRFVFFFSIVTHRIWSVINKLCLVCPLNSLLTSQILNKYLKSFHGERVSIYILTHALGHG